MVQASHTPFSHGGMEYLQGLFSGAAGYIYPQSFVDVLDNKVSNQRIDIVVDQRRIAGIDRKAPLLFSIKINKLPLKIFHRCCIGRDKSSVVKFGFHR